MRAIHTHLYASPRRPSVRALVAAALGCGFAVTSASAQSMGTFGRSDQADGGTAASRRTAPAPQPAPAPVLPVRVAPSAPAGPTQSYQPARGGGFAPSYGSGPSYGNGQSYGGSVYNNPPPRNGVTFGTTTTSRPPANYPPATYPSRGTEAGGSSVNYPPSTYPSRGTAAGGSSLDNSNRGGYRNGGSRDGSGETRGDQDPTEVRGASRTTGHPYSGLDNLLPHGDRGRSADNGSGGYSRLPIRVTTPQGQRDWDRHHDGDGYVYGGGTTIITDGPVLLGGYYYGGYTDYGYGQNIYPSIYTTYGGFPQYICNPSVIVLSQPYYPVYTTPYLPFYQPTYQVTYNENNYYTTSEDKASEIRDGGDNAKEAVKSAYKDGSYQAAFADIAKAWQDGNIAPLRKHLRDDDTKVSILLKRKYAYSIASGDFEQITRDALDRLSTVSFKFTRIRKAKNGDVTAYGEHVYRVTDDATSGDAVKDGDTVPFDASASDQPYAQSADPAPGDEKSVYVAYTLRHKDDLWYIIAVNSSPTPLVKTDEDQDTSDQ